MTRRSTKPNAIAWACQRCHSMTKHGSRLAICMPCRQVIAADGLLWCNTCKRVKPVLLFTTPYRCTACCTLVSRRSRRVDPPANYITLATVARRIGYSKRTITDWIHFGWCGDVVWRRGRQCRFYLPDLSSYPPRPLGYTSARKWMQRKERTP